MINLALLLRKGWLPVDRHGMIGFAQWESGFFSYTPNVTISGHLPKNYLQGWNAAKRVEELAKRMENPM